jgi:hypothetical protein
MMRQSHTAVVARNEAWSGGVATEPFEAAWASEAIAFLRVLEVPEGPPGGRLRVQVSPDGMRWCDEGSSIELPTDPDVPTFVRLRHFGGWLRLAGALPDGVRAKVIAYLVLKE